MNDEELMHYGVLGMRWGVRKNPARAFTRASKKMDRLDYKSTKAQNKAQRAKYSRFTSEDKYNKRVFKADKVTYRAAKWYQSVAKVMGNEKAATMVNRDGYNMGKRYADWFIYR